MTLVGPVGSWFQMVGKVSTLLWRWVGPVGSWFQMVEKVPTLLWRWLVLLVPGSRW